MKIIDIEYIVNKGPFVDNKVIEVIQNDITNAINEICWPPGQKGFYLRNGSTGRGRGEGNGVKPIKDAFVEYLSANGWEKEYRYTKQEIIKSGPIDALKITEYGKFAVEWETGNISSSHRALNKICLGVLKGVLIGGALILPSKSMYKYLTDRIGNYPEIEPYMPLWKLLPFIEGSIFIIIVEHDGVLENIPRIPKGTDGRALL